ncbi:Ribosomal large subunit pseudouridine synthase E [hydrothermal vent metagenome]|uniref:Ribosomal large subunit pseudouridine synthase E n=1 Tax=hydrothermal vent metagenome TaxID=652676 RepID=A0A3B1AFJ7_9ZZZZ
MILIAFNKPFDVVCQFRPHPPKQTLSNYIETENIYPCGRLDRDSEGLLLLTDDGLLQHRITAPKLKMKKGYWVQVEGIPTPEALNLLSKGVELNDGMTSPAQVQAIAEPQIWEREPPIRERKSIPTQWLDISIKEGRNRQIRRMTAKIGYPTLRLIRYRIGPWYLNDLGSGQSELRDVPKSIENELKQLKGKS